MEQPKAPRRSLKHPFSALSHLVGAILSVIGLALLLFAPHHTPIERLAFAVYGGSLLLLYILSTLYHSMHVSPALESRLQQLDHIAIFLLIAGSYTPVCLVTLHGRFGDALLAGIWSLAAAGILAILFWRGHPHWIRVALYVLMGWLAVIALPALYSAFGATGMAWLVAGGLAYTGGVYFYAKDRTDDYSWRGPLTPHDIWHLFVLAGSICHFILILFFIAL